MLRLGAKAFPETGAKVIALASITGVYAEHGLAVYGATKAALISLVETFNVEESKNGVAATALAPGYVDTDMTAWAQETIASDQMIRVDDIVELVDALLADVGDVGGAEDRHHTLGRRRLPGVARHGLAAAPGTMVTAASPFSRRDSRRTRSAVRDRIRHQGRTT